MFWQSQTWRKDDTRIGVETNSSYVYNLNFINLEVKIAFPLEKLKRPLMFAKDYFPYNFINTCDMP